MTTRRRRTQWYETIFSSTVLGADAQAGHDLLSNMATGQRQGATVTRMIIDIHMYPTALTTQQGLFYGIAIMGAEALAAGAFPEADVPEETDWLVHGHLTMKSANLSDGTQSDRARLDIRSQRIMRAQQDRLILVYDNETGTPVDRSHFIRVLMRLP